MSRSRKPTQDEIDLFRSTVADARPLQKSDQQMPVHLNKPRPAAIPVQRQLDEHRALEEMSDGHYDPTEHETGEELLFSRPGLQQKLLRKLRSGQLSIRHELDLHGLTVPLARTALSEFLLFCQEREIRCIRIIHGKGYNSPGKQPVLKGKLNHWLRQRDQVLAFCSAPQVTGGTGAVNVLLKRS